MKRITVLIAQDHFVVREGLRSLLERESDIEVVGAAETGYSAVQLARRFRPAVVIMDIAMPLLNGLEATRQIRQSLPDTKVIILSAHSDDAYVEKMTQLGAARFLPKQNSSQFLVAAVREVQKGTTFFRTSTPGRLNGGDESASSRPVQNLRDSREPPNAATTHRRDYLTPHIAELGEVVEMEVVRGANLRMGLDPLGGAGVHDGRRIAEGYGLNPAVVHAKVDPPSAS